MQSRTSAAARHSWASNRGRRRHVLSRFPHERPATPFSARARIPVRSRGQGCRSCNLPWLRILQPAMVADPAPIGCVALLSARMTDDQPPIVATYVEVVCARSRGAAAEPHVDGAPQKSFGTLLGRTAVMRELFAQMGKMAQTPASILISGETGRKDPRNRGREHPRADDERRMRRVGDEPVPVEDIERSFEGRAGRRQGSLIFAWHRPRS